MAGEKTLQKLTRKDFELRGQWDRSRLRDTDLWYYEIVYTQTGKVLNGRYSSKQKAWKALSEKLKKYNAVRDALIARNNEEVHNES